MEAGESGPPDSSTGADERAGLDGPAPDGVDPAGLDGSDRAGTGTEAEAEAAAAAGIESSELEPGEGGPAEAVAPAEAIPADEDQAGKEPGDLEQQPAESAETAGEAGPAGPAPEAGEGEPPGAAADETADEDADAADAEPGPAPDAEPGPAPDAEGAGPGETAGDKGSTAVTELAAGPILGSDNGTGQDAKSAAGSLDGDGDDTALASQEKQSLLPYTRTESGGLNFLPANDTHTDPGSNAARTEGIPGYTDVIIHGSPEIFGLGGKGPVLSPQQMADIIQSAPDYDGGPVRLVSCNSGKLPDGAAQQVADLLNQPVIAASDKVWPLYDGRLIVGPVPVIPSGEWRLFNPRKDAK